MRLSLSFPAGLLLAAACSTNPVPAPASGSGPSQAVSAGAPASARELLTRMHARYAGSWYRTLTFVQRTSFPNRPAETWYEAAAFPGKLRIDIAPLDSMRATLYVGDSAFSFRGGRRVNARKDRNLLLTLGFDVYGQPVTTSEAQLSEAGIDLGRMHRTTWQGRPAWVVGAGAGDTTSSQFWVDAERLVFVRLIEQVPAPNNRTGLLDVEFNKYQRLGGGWIAPEVIIRVDGREVMREEYSDMRADVELPADLFSTASYTRPGWIEGIR